MSVNLTRDELLIKLGQAKAQWPRGWRLVDVEIDPKLAAFHYGLNRKKLRQARRREGRYLLRRLYVLALRRRLALDAHCEGCSDWPGGASRKEDEP